MDKLIFKKNIISANIKKFKEDTKNLTRLKLVFPVKTCTNYEILKIFYNEGFGFDVSNSKELKVVSQYECFKSFVGPKCSEIETNEEHYIIYYDNLDDYKKSNIDEKRKGIRINFNSNKKIKFSHFGEDFNSLNDDIYRNVNNIHFHLGDCNSDKMLKSILKEVCGILNRCPNLKTLDIGGGYESIQSNKFLEFLTTINSKLDNRQCFILECGDLWFKNSGKLCAQVVNKKQIAKNTFIIYLSISKDCNLKWSSPVYIHQTEQKIFNRFKYYFYGASCYEKDLIGKTISNDDLKINDIICFSNISHYSVEWNTSFNGIDKIEVVYE